MTGAPRWALAVATMGGLGRLPAPGTFGSLPALLAAWMAPLPLLALGVLLAILGHAAIAAVLRAGAPEDPGWVVVDETVGMLIALAALGGAPTLAGLLLAFVLFRAFDILKPWPVSAAERLPGACGIMLDDVVAGMLACALVALARHLWPGVI